ncbi:MAG: LOG family protein [Acidobacteriota bacterium]|nr:LOG family protein [Acidobacteriota bacterium]MDQ5871714.1 LOG family protein [Acidobacteriota bacterium]
MTVSIAVLGSSRAAADSSDYQHALSIGREISRRGGRVVCGGYGGIMEAVCRGASEAGGSSLGVLLGNGEPNAWVSAVVREDDLAARLRRLSAESSAAIFLSRGLGTLLEIAWMAESIAKGHVPARPLVFLGLFWRRAAALAVGEAVGPGASALAASVRFVAAPEQAVAEAMRIEPG